MHARPLRFGVALMQPAGKLQWQAKCKQAEDLGYDVITVPDFIGGPSPMLALALAAQVTDRPRLGSYAVNCGFYRPALLARDVEALIELGGGRMEIGLGTGYSKADFELAGLPWTSAADRIEHLTLVVARLRRLLELTATPLLIGGSGRRLLSYAASQANIVSLTGAETRIARGKARLMPRITVTDRLDRIRRSAGSRTGQIELNVLVHSVFLTSDREAAAAFYRDYAPHLPETDLNCLPSLLCGSEQSIAEDIEEHRRLLGISYFTVLEPAMVDFARVLNRLN